MKLIIISGLSGSGKTVALRSLEDQGHYCIDNLPLGLLSAFVTQLLKPKLQLYEVAAVGIDARSGIADLNRFGAIMNEIRAQEVEVEVVFLQADIHVLLKRYNETRRLHPLSRKGMPLIEAIHVEKSVLSAISEQADLLIDTSQTNVHQLAATIRDRVGSRHSNALSIQIQSFGFKNGAPADSDFVFDVRCLPNPHWEPQLRNQTGLDPAVQKFLEDHASVEKMYDDVLRLLTNWIPRFEADNRSYLTISIGCTGGQHRSVYLVERLSAYFKSHLGASVTVRHRELERKMSASTTKP